MGFHHAGFWIEMEIPNALQQHCAGQNAAFTAHENFQQRKLARLKLDQCAAATRLSFYQIQFQISDPQDCGLLLSRGATP